MAKRIADLEQPNLFRDGKTGIYYLRKYITGKREIERSLKTTSRSTALREMNRVLKEWLGTSGPSRRILFDDVEAEVLEIYQSKSERTFESYETFRRLYLVPFFTGWEIRDVAGGWGKYKAHQRKNTPEKLRKQGKQRKLDHDRDYLRIILRHALNCNYIEKLPELPLDPQDKVVTEGREYSNEDLSKLFEKASSPRRKRARLALELQLKTGMRNNERRLLRYDYIDREKGTITLPPEIVKTRYGRTYYVDPDLLERMFSLRKGDSPYVFPHRNDPSQPQTATDKTFQRIKKEAGLGGMRQHWLRHTFVTRAVRHGIAGPLVQKAVGMSDQVMKRVYLHANADDAKKIATVVGETMNH